MANLQKQNKSINNLLSDVDYKKAEKLYKEKKYDEAYQEYIKLSDIYKGNKKIYKRLIETLTHDYTVKENNRDFKKAFNNYVVSYKILATKRELTILENKLKDYDNIKSSRSRFLLIAFFGIFGVHKFIEKKYIWGIIYFFTLGVFGIGVLIDLINDYATYEDDKQLDIYRYIISIIILLIALYKNTTIHYYFLILASILFTPFVFSELLKFLPKTVKIIAIIALCFLGLTPITIVDSVPSNLVGLWKTNNENTNFVSIDIKSSKTTINFSDRESEVGTNEYNNSTKVLKVYVNETKYYKFKLDSDNKRICKVNESNNCHLSFEK